ncbi:MAG: tetratricopeptide repeat protein [Phycisphaerales bacterium]|nr:MAG: tetratricopeptide repeat protein [Phycisphaerales bacterium]
MSGRGNRYRPPIGPLCGMRAVCAAFAVVSVLCSLAAGAQLSPEQRLEVLTEAQQAYDRGAEILPTNPGGAAEQFRLAAARFQLLIDDGVVNGPILYNLGNAYLQVGELGQAILQYRRAERFIPADARLEGNLRFARSLCRDQIAPSGQRALADALLLWHHSTSPHFRLWLFGVGYMLFWIILISWLFRPPGFWRYPAGACAVIWIACGTSLTMDLVTAGSHREGVVIQDEVIVRKGNGEGFAPQFEQPLHEGVEFRLAERRGDWLSIELPDGKTGWLPARAAGLIER